MHLGGNHRWVPLSFENNNNNNNKRYRAHKFCFTISSAVSSIQLHSGGQTLLFSWAENSRPPSPVWTTYYGVRRCYSKQISLVVAPCKGIWIPESRKFLPVEWTVPRSPFVFWSKLTQRTFGQSIDLEAIVPSLP